MLWYLLGISIYGRDLFRIFNDSSFDSATHLHTPSMEASNRLKSDTIWFLHIKVTFQCNFLFFWMILKINGFFLMCVWYIHVNHSKKVLSFNVLAALWGWYFYIYTCLGLMSSYGNDSTLVTESFWIFHQGRNLGFMILCYWAPHLPPYY